MFKIIWEDKAEESLARIDKKIGQKIKSKVENYLV